MPKTTQLKPPDDVAAALAAELVKNESLTKRMVLVDDFLDTLGIVATADPPQEKPNMKPGEYTLLTISTLAARLNFIADRLDILTGELDLIRQGDD